MDGAIVRKASLIVVLALFAVALVAGASLFASDCAYAAPLVASQGGSEADEGQEQEEQAHPSLQIGGGAVSVSACVQGSGWKRAVSGGKTAGTKGKKALRGLKVSLTGFQKARGSIKYQIYARGKGWKKAVGDGASSGKAKDVEAVRIWLTGEVAQHYDVLYRVYMKGKGWQPWVKNKARAGLVKKGVRVGAVQVVLSPKTEDALGRPTDAVGVHYEGRLHGAGWLKWANNGATAGKASKKKQLEGFAVKVDAGSYAGSVIYRGYVQGKKWKQGWKRDGATIGKNKKRLEAVQIKLAGEISQYYDIYYRTYVQGYGWLDWAMNGATAGGPGNKLRVGAIQVRLVAKGEAAPGKTVAPTVALMDSGLNGIDISSWQPTLDPAKVDADFIVVKATGGKNYTNPYFKVHANATLKAGKLLGLYHFACDRGHVGTAEQEADYFASAVGPYVGKAVLVLDWEADALLKGTSWAKTFLDRVYKKTGVRPMIYMSKSYTRSYDWSKVAGNYRLWVAQYPNYKKTGYQVNPWTDSYSYGAWKAPTMFQYTSTGSISGYSGNLDLNKFYGTAADWKRIAAKS